MLSIQEKDLSIALQAAIPGLGNESATSRARTLISTIDGRLEKNLLEWIRGELVSDIWIEKYCINAILAIRKDQDFLSALEAMNLYLKDPQLGELLIWRVRR